MKNVKRIAALLLALVMVFALCACSDSGSGKDKDKDDKVEKVEKKTDAELIVGTWEATVDMGEYFDTLMDYDDDMLSAYFDFTGVELVVNYEFDKDGSYKLSFSAADEEKLEMVLRKAVEKLLNDMFEGAGYTIEEVAAANGMTVDELVDDAMEENGVSSEAFFDDSNDSGSYKIKDGKLYLAEDGDELDEDDYFEYKLKGDKLTLVAEYEDGELSDESEAELYPMDFVRK